LIQEQKRAKLESYNEIINQRNKRKVAKPVEKKEEKSEGKIKKQGKENKA
jgi:hypothetical protein